eukprot:scaffold46661_cov36-Prasinocladus_malaysianus.AAC.1
MEWRDTLLMLESFVGTLRSGSRLGKGIDGHTAVIRLAHSPVKGFEDDVGKKCALAYTRNMLQSYQIKVFMHFN